ncbi:MAG: hypothetical protein QM775_34040 [Pirellulales bacterium]
MSLDGKPRSLSIRQGADVWLGYHLERATVLKAWQAPKGKPGLIKSGFVTRSTGVPWFQDASDAGWKLRRGDTDVPLVVRYLGCSQRKDHIELRWELSHDAGAVKLYERVPLAAATAVERVVRELRAEQLAPDETLIPPLPVREAWKITSEDGSSVAILRGMNWHRLTLP